MQKLTVKSEVFNRGVETIITDEALKKLLDSGKRLRVKHGIDATSPDLHIGHAASLWKLKTLQEAGHKAVILLGDTTTLIGDPTGRSEARPSLSREIIEKNIISIEKQIRQILVANDKALEIRRSSEWYDQLALPEFLQLLSSVTHARLIERDMFQERIKSGREIYMHEFIYPILQGYDSVMLKSDLTIIGSDQLFNEHLGRILQEKFKQAPQAIITLKILPGLDGGEKMSKSRGNYIGLNDSPQDKFGKAMTIQDRLILDYLEAYTNVSVEEIKKITSRFKSGGNPMETKLFFAEALVRRYHGKNTAVRERERFLSIFSKKEFIDIPEIKLQHGKYKILGLLDKLKFIVSKSEGRRLLKQGAVEIDGGIVRDEKLVVDISKNTLIRVGKRRVVRIR